MKTHDIIKIEAVFLTTMLVLVPIMSIGNAVEVKANVHPAVGDYIVYNMQSNNMVKQMSAEYFGENANISINRTASEVKFTGEESITVNGVSYDCIVGVQSVDISFDAGGEYNEMKMTGNMHILMTEKNWLDKDTNSQVKTEHVESMFGNLTVSTPIANTPQTQTIAKKTVIEIIYDPPMRELPGDVNAGDSWNISSNISSETTHMHMGDNGNWITDGESQKSVYVRVNQYKAVGDATITTPAGTFQTLKIKMWSNGNGSKDYSLIYANENGMPVKVEVYSGGSVVMSQEATEYHYADAKSGNDTSSGNNGSPGFEAFVALAAIALAGIAYSVKRR